MPSWDSSCVADIIRLLRADDSALLRVQLSVLAELPYEAKRGRINVSRQRIFVVMETLNAAFGGVLAHLLQLMSSDVAQGHDAVQEKIFACLSSWLRYASPPPSALIGNALLLAPFDALSHAPLFEAAVDCIVELVNISGQSLDESSQLYHAATAEQRHAYEQLRDAIVPRALALKNEWLRRGGAANDDEDEAIGFARIFTEMAEW
jgi:hypothetical protein